MLFTGQHARALRPTPTTAIATHGEQSTVGPCQGTACRYRPGRGQGLAGSSQKEILPLP